MKIIGSTAAKHWDILVREPKDFDMVLANDKRVYRQVPDELVIDSKGLPPGIYDRLAVGRYGHVIPNHLYTIKMSHIFWDIKWNKHINDILTMRSKGCTVEEELFIMLYNYWCEVHGDKSFLNMNKGKDQFFNDHVPYIYDHDYLHTLVAYEDKPMYTKVLRQGCDVMIDKDKFLALSEIDKLRMIREECYVIALERWLIPQEFKISNVRAYSMALKKMITNLSKGWFARYIADNYHHLHRSDKHNYVKLFKERKINDDRFYKR